jgi:ATP-dependent Clp protease protease subunit
MNQNSEFYKYATKHVGINSNLVGDVIKHQVTALTPMILEERVLNVTQLSVFDRLLLDRILWVSGVVDDRMADIIQAQLLFLESTDSNKDIKMMISSPGGSCMDGLAIRDVMNYIKPDVVTTNVGMAASMASILLSSGTKGKRTGLINSKVMIHHVSAGASGVVDDMRINLMEAEKYNYILFKILAENCNKTFDEVHDMAQRDKWFNSDEALKFNLIDEIIGVDKNKTITTMLDGFDTYYNKYVLDK